MIISLSILNIEKENRKTKIEQFSSYSSDNWIHFDVMDGKFVENKTFAYEVVNEVGKYCSLFKDVHLMTYEPEKYLKEYKKAGTDQITFHYESVDKNNILNIINKIKSYDMKVGMSIKPNTRVEEIEEYLPHLDLVLVMSVEPGKGGQKYLENSTEKIKRLKEKQKDNHYLISVDGGINDITSKIVKQAGADIVVVGSYITNANDYEKQIKNLI